MRSYSALLTISLLFGGCYTWGPATGRQVCERSTTPVASLADVERLDVRRIKVAETLAVAVIASVASFYLSAIAWSLGGGLTVF